jgi:hypothetical protein
MLAGPESRRSQHRSAALPAGRSAYGKENGRQSWGAALAVEVGPNHDGRGDSLVNSYPTGQVVVGWATSTVRRAWPLLLSGLVPACGQARERKYLYALCIFGHKEPRAIWPCRTYPISGSSPVRSGSLTHRT